MKTETAESLLAALAPLAKALCDWCEHKAAWDTTQETRRILAKIEERQKENDALNIGGEL